MVWVAGLGSTLTLSASFWARGDQRCSVVLTVKFAAATGARAYAPTGITNGTTWKSTASG